jgi:predicted short-subunit dehydrogenase-like oxidoreductase (DUF2520 family)
MKTLNIIGAGRVGRTLAALWNAQQSFAVRHVLAGSIEAARSAVAFIGAGTAVQALDDMGAADVWMLTTPDRRIAESGSALAGAGLLRSGDVVFHCSGSLASAALNDASDAGAAVASVHPLKTFADPAEATRTFQGTYCVMEGESAALDVLGPAFEGIGARLSRIGGERKTLYHAACVLVCNDFTALLEAGLRCFEQAGIPRETATTMMAPLVRETLDNVVRVGPGDALTGPVARGDALVVEKHLQALGQWDPQITAIYRELGRVGVELARAKQGADGGALDRIAALFQTQRSD